MSQPVGAATRAKRFAFFFLAMTLVAQGAVASGAKVLKIDPRGVIGAQYMPDEITTMLEELGYEWRHVTDPDSHRKVKMSRQDGQYKMQFEGRQARGIRIDVHVRIVDSVTGLHVKDEDGETPASVFEAAFETLKARAEMEFGPDNVTESSWLFAP